MGGLDASLPGQIRSVAAAYGPSIAIVFLWIFAKALTHLYRHRRLVVGEEAFHLGLPLLLSSLVLALWQLAGRSGELNGSDWGLAGVFLFCWLVCFAWVFGWHRSYRRLSDQDLVEAVKKRENRAALLIAIVSGIWEPGPEPPEVSAQEESRRFALARRERQFRLTSLASAFGALSVMLYDALVAKTFIVVFRG